MVPMSTKFIAYYSIQSTYQLTATIQQCRLSSIWRKSEIYPTQWFIVFPRNMTRNFIAANTENRESA